MFCPRCGSQNTETTKFCRQCGLALLEVTNYVVTGGTSSLQVPPTAQIPVNPGSFSPKQKMWLSILCLIFLPGLAAIISDGLDVSELIVPAAGVLMIPGIVFAVMYFRNQARMLEQMQRQQVQQPTTLYAQPQPQAFLQAPMMPVSNPSAVQSRPGQNTNPLAHQPQSVIEDETRRLPNQ
jgi:hypothetical protein